MAMLDALVALRQKMTGSAELNEIITGTFDEEAPRDQKGPYCVIGYAHESEGRLLADSERRGWVRIHIWSGQKSKLEVLKVYAVIDKIVTDNCFLFEDFEIITDTSSGWRHGIVTYRFYYDREE